MDSVKKKILVVDDDEVLRDILINFLEVSGYEAIGA
jgi:DNA-binding response OmpR family regulator